MDSVMLMTVMFGILVVASSNLFILFSQIYSLGLHSNVDGSMRRKEELKEGRRCLGQGTIFNSCGMLHTKLIICGMKNNNKVLLK